MDNWDWGLGLIIALGIFLIWRHEKASEKKRAVRLAEAERERLNDESIAKEQAAFEGRLEGDNDLPDAVRGRDAFVYWNLMRPWYSKLVAAKRYDEAQSEKIRKDWLAYMWLLEHRSTSSYLSAESRSAKKQEEYWREAASESAQASAIEDAFAAAIGSQAVTALEEVNARDKAGLFAFDRTGKKPMAPLGHHYFPKSIRPYVEELVPDKRSPEDTEPASRPSASGRA